MTQVLEGDLLTRMLIHASASLQQEKQTINELNVFPVPDGDTGTNMSLTVGTAAAELMQKQPQRVSETAAMTANAMLRGARGNSGVILSLLFRGFAKTIKDADSVDGRLFAEALDAGVLAAYKAVMKPAEGTMLTVSRMAAVRAMEAAQTNDAVEYVLQEALLAAREALAQTIEQNPVLKKAGVVDAGGVGYVLLLQGMLDALQGAPMPQFSAEAMSIPAQRTAVFQKTQAEEIQFAYCTEFICARENNKDPEQLRTFLQTRGDSLVLVDDDEIIKVHVHTNHPGRVLEEALTYGALLTVKIENMREQHTEILAAASGEEAQAVVVPEKRYGFVAVCAGEGLAKVFAELGVDGIIQGGQTMNPSTEDILREVRKTPAEIVYVLPNNKNIIMAAEQCVPLVEGKQVIVLPSKTVPEGMSALLNMDYDADEADNTQTMMTVMQGVTTMEVTHAARDSSFDGEAIREGDYLALKNGQLFGSDEHLEALLCRMAADLKDGTPEFITVFYGEGVSEDEAQKTAALFRAACPTAELTVVNGMQPVYPYFISAE